MTYSITGRCARSGQLGYAMASYDINFVPPFIHSSSVSEAGAVTCQASTRPGFGAKVAERLGAGAGAPDALGPALAGEPARDFFQVCVVDSAGASAAHTGARTLGWNGHRLSRGCAAAGNLLAGEAVLEAMVATFEREDATDLPERLLLALEAGYAAGGDRRGTRGTSLWLAGPGLPEGLAFLRVQEHPQPLDELGRLLRVARQETGFMADVLDAARVLVPLVDERAVLQRHGAETTLEALRRLQGELDPATLPDGALSLLARIERHLRETHSPQAELPFRDTYGAIRAFLSR